MSLDVAELLDTVKRNPSLMNEVINKLLDQLAFSELLSLLDQIASQPFCADSKRKRLSELFTTAAAEASQTFDFIRRFAIRLKLCLKKSRGRLMF